MQTQNETFVTFDGGEATAYIAYRTNEVCAIYPITPSTPMAELSDQWSSSGINNIWGQTPLVIEMQSEGGAAGALHGALQTGALTTTFTASQGLMLMIPNMYKIAGELTPTVFHVAARSLAAQGLSIFGDHQDVMAVRQTGFAQLASSSVQECHDMALIAQAVTLESRVPVLHFFDGFRTSHEINKISLISDTHIRAMIDDKLVQAHRQRALNPDAPVMRGTAQNPDTYFQGRESVNAYYTNAVKIFEDKFKKFAELTGRHYQLFEYHGDPEAERVIIIMGSGAETVSQTVDHLRVSGEKVGVLKVRVFRPFSALHLMRALPKTVVSIAVLDRTKEPGADGEPLYKDIITELAQTVIRGEMAALPRIIGGRYGLSSKEFTPAMVARIYSELRAVKPKNGFTIGIRDDRTFTSLDNIPPLDIEPNETVRAVFFGLGSDGTVGANKNSIKIIGAEPQFYAQGYFVYDSKKAGSITVSHLRFGPTHIEAPYLISSASFVACHQYAFIEQVDMLSRAGYGATFLLNSPHNKDVIWAKLPQRVQQQIIDKNINFYVIDGAKVARSVGMGSRINTVMQTCFFALSGVMPKELAIKKIKAAAEKSYARKGMEIVQRNFAAIDQALAHLEQVSYPAQVTSIYDPDPKQKFVNAPAFVKSVTSELILGNGDLIPVTLLPDDGTYPTGTTQWEKRNIAVDIPIWESDLCIQCGNCSAVCPHAAIRAKFYGDSLLKDAPEGFKSANISARGFPELRYTLQIYPEDCTGCKLCVEACPVSSEQSADIKAINMQEKLPHLSEEKRNLTFFESLPYNDRSAVDFSNIRGVQYLQPLFEFSGACAGCGETPYLKLVSQLFGDRALIANATGCSSIYGGNLPTTPWSKNADGKGPAWCNSLFEDNAEFGLGFRLTSDQHLALAEQRLRELREPLSAMLDEKLIDETLNSQQIHESDIRKQRDRVVEIAKILRQLNDPLAEDLLSVIDHLVRRSVWIVGGDGWAYDIGYGGVDHVLASGRNVNILVMDTEVYSNTGGQASKATPIGAVAKFAAGGKVVPQKDLSLQAIAYGNVYVARIALGANPQQTLQALREAEAYDGPSLIIAYSHCIEHGISMSEGMQQQKLAVKCGYWPLYRYNPDLHSAGSNPFILDSLRPDRPLTDYTDRENRYKVLRVKNPSEADRLMAMAQKVVNQKWSVYEEMATRDVHEFIPDTRLD
ncbi:pyruvate:ferredoxin (flavodoxin) oxidoreductase [Teredinibacter waterburyi]|uniref:pyruvate:ferredoxin (flavodoxin) oxidoreductase n=1 Tax=Teredinibacter waterburyi TaxID=1500538 RepID=UPI00165ECA08|nr:pyruvate:ferredoxin (flavodoxin) oxidoreductase [Teredinibacter waterburyi]